VRTGGRSTPLDDDNLRRAVYGYTDRFRIPTLLRNFDMANPDQSIARRATTTHPLQALFFLNSPFVRAQAEHLNRQPEIAEQPDPRLRLELLYRRILARRPEADELDLGLRFLGTEPDPENGRSARRRCCCPTSFSFAIEDPRCRPRVLIPLRLSRAAKCCGGAALGLVRSGWRRCWGRGRWPHPRRRDLLAARAPHFRPRAKRVIQILANGGPSQMDTFDPKPALNRYHGQRLPIHLQTERPTSTALGSPFSFARYGQSGLEVSELFAPLAEKHADDLVCDPLDVHGIRRCTRIVCGC
jgi:hypothetical protein